MAVDLVVQTASRMIHTSSGFARLSVGFPGRDRSTAAVGTISWWRLILAISLEHDCDTRATRKKSDSWHKTESLYKHPVLACRHISKGHTAVSHEI